MAPLPADSPPWASWASNKTSNTSWTVWTVWIDERLRVDESTDWEVAY